MSKKEFKNTGKGLYLVAVKGDTAEVTFLPIGVENDKGETYFQVRDHVVKSLADKAYDGKSKMIKHLVAQNIRSQLKGATGFETVFININIDEMDKKSADSDSDDVVDEDEEVEEEDVAAPVPNAPSYTGSY